MRPILLLCFLVSGAVLPAQILYTYDSVEVHRTDTIYFDFGSAQILPLAELKLINIAEDYHPGLQMYLEGHTDAVGSSFANEQLGERRAAAVGEYLRKYNIPNSESGSWPAEDIVERSFGENDLVINTQNREERNRRVLLRSGVPRRYARLRGRVTDENDQPLSGLVIAHGRYLRDSTTADDEGYYEVTLPLDQVVGLDIYAPGHLFSTQMFRIDTTREIPALKMKLTKAEIGARMDVPDLFFHGNQAVLINRSKSTLPRLLTFMQLNPDTKVEIAGHINFPGRRQGPGTWQYNLAVNRAKAIYDYLVDNGIAAERMRPKGYSNYELRYPQPATAEQSQANRRVEIRVIE